MLDDLLEIAAEAVLEIGGEVVGSAIERRRTKKKNRGKAGKAPQGGEPWEQKEKRPPWEG